MTTQQTEAVRLMTEILVRHPELRIGQLVDWAAFVARPDDPLAAANIEDEELVIALRRQWTDLQRAANEEPVDLITQPLG
jgi:hypothetical protein